MVDQSHNLKGKIEATIQTVATAQELWARAALVDHTALAKLQDNCDLVGAEEMFRDAFWTRRETDGTGVARSPSVASGSAGCIAGWWLCRTCRQDPGSSQPEADHQLRLSPNADGEVRIENH